MAIITRSLNAAYLFLVGDMRILIGTLGALMLAGLLAPWSPLGAGTLLVVLLALTLLVALRCELPR